MKAQLEIRLNELKTEFESGQKILAETETKKADLQATLLRISGAIQVLQELLADEIATVVEDEAEQLVGTADQADSTKTEPEADLVSVA